MRPIPFAFLLIGTSVAYFAIHAATGLGEVSLTPGLAVACALAGVCLLFAQLFAYVDRRINQPPKPPYFLIDKVHGPVLELDTNGSYESCELFLSTLAAEFSAEYSAHLDGGPRPDLDKDKGYWNVTVSGQEFFVMRHRGHGICIWGPKPPADLDGFLRIAGHFKAVEYLKWQQKVFGFVVGRSPTHHLTQTK